MLKYQDAKAFQSLAKQWDVVHLVGTIFGRGLKNIWCPSQYLQKGNAAAIFYSFFVKSVFLLTTFLLLSSIFDFAFYENIAARVTFGCHTYINFQSSLCELEMKSDMTLGRQEKKVMRHLVVPA